MCGICGCGDNENIIKVTLPSEVKSVLQELSNHNHSHLHTHGNGHHHHHQHEDSKVIQVEKDILRENDLIANRNKGYFEAKDIFAINLVSSPGSGKTCILEKTLADLKNNHSFYVIEGDQQTMNDADRIAALEIPVVQINTGKACHLDAVMVNKAVKKLNPDQGSTLFIENVGNLVCPAMFDLGESKRVVIMSVTEGEDKAIKYPDMFHTAQLCIINKIDLLPYVDFNVDNAKKYALKVNPNLQFIEVSATMGTGMDQWYEWLTRIHLNI